MIGVPNMRIVMRDDWVEIQIASWQAGFVLDFTFYPDGTVTQREQGYYDAGPVKMSVYDALTQIADISAANVQAMDDFNASGGQL